MIIPYKQVQRMVNEYPVGVVGYHWGNEYELKEYLKAKKENVYPLLWYVLPQGDHNYPKRVDWMETNISLFLATITKLSWLNDKREIETFDRVLNPTTAKIISMLEQSNNIDVISDNIISNPLPNYYEQDIGNESNAYWDVRTISFQARVYNKCLNQINL